MNSLLSIRNLSVSYYTSDNTVRALNHVDLDLKHGETLGLLGETGAGKTTLAKSIMRLIQSPPGKVDNGAIMFQEIDLLKASIEDIRTVRGKEISMIFQDPMSALDPVITVEKQIAEVIRVHNPQSTHIDITSKALDMLETVGIPAERGEDYPHQFSGGMKQRVVIAIALACNPQILIADEPTTALDVTIQAQVLEMMKALKVKYNTAILLITHDMGVIAQMCDRVAVIYAGEIVELGTVHDIFKNTKHPYTHGLLGAIPKIHIEEHRLKPIDGLMPDPAALPHGCYFNERCRWASDKCRLEHPALVCAGEDGHLSRCWRFEEKSVRRLLNEQ